MSLGERERAKGKETERGSHGNMVVRSLRFIKHSPEKRIVVVVLTSQGSDT